MEIAKGLGILFFSAFLLHPSPLLASSSPLRGGLEAGPFQAGFRVIQAYDGSRSWLPAARGKEEIHPERRERPIRIYLWYPALKASTSSPMAFKVYADLMEEDYWPRSRKNSGKGASIFLSSPLARSLSKERQESVLTAKTLACLEAEPLKGPFPLLVFGQGLYFESPATHAFLCEFLATHGYVVATCPLVGTYSRLVNLDLVDLETQIRDLEYVIAYARKLPFADEDALGLIGFDLGGMSSLILSMRNPEVDAFASLDSGILFEHNTRLLKQSPHYNLERFSAPLLHITRTPRENAALQVVEDLSLFQSSPFAETYLLRIKSMRHVDFTSYALIEGKQPLPFYWGNAEGNPQKSYESVCLYVLHFFNACLKNKETSRAFLERKPADTVPHIPATLEHTPGTAPPPTGDDFLNTLFESGVEEAALMVREAKALHPGCELVQEETLNRLGYQFLYFWGHPDMAVAIFKLSATLYPESANAFDSLAEAYMRQGEKGLARKNYRKSLELNPENRNAREALEGLKNR